MAIHGKEELNNTQGGNNPQPNANEGTHSRGGQTETRQQTGSFGGSLSFGSRDIFTMMANQGSEYTTGIAKAIMESYKNLPTTLRPKVSILDKEVINNLAYSAVVVSNETAQTVNYFVILLEATGRKPMKAQEIVAEVQNASKMQGIRPMIYTTDDAIDSVLHTEIRSALAKEYGENKNAQSVDGLVVHTHHGDLVVLATKLAAIAYNACAVDAALESGDIKDLNIAQARSVTPNTMLKIDSNMSRIQGISEVEEPVRSDWNVELNMIDTTSQMTSLNLQNNKNTLTKVSGFVDAIPEIVEIPTMPGAPVNVHTRFRPHVIITSNSVHTPTTGYMLLGLINSLVMTNSNMWLASLTPTDSKHNVGALNLFSNLENDQNGVGQSLVSELTGKDKTPDQVYAVIKQMFSLSPMLSMDIESFGPQTFYKSILATAAQPGNNDAKIHAAQELIQVASWLTSGNFPSDFPIDQIFVNSGIVIPTGTWADKSGERDIRDIDLAFIASRTGDTNLMTKWALSNLPKESSGNDPYLAKVEVIAQLIPDAEITGKAIRVTFSNKFITTLSNAATAAGLDVRYEPEIKFAENQNIAILGNYLANAGIDNAAGFARQQMHQGSNFATQYSGMGYGRY